MRRSEEGDQPEIVEIDFTVGHRSIGRDVVTSQGYTHDWVCYLKSTDVHGDLNALIQRCIFHLHPEFQNNKREIRTSPFAIQETGYGGFSMPIDIYFKTKKDPKKFRIEYDLDLHDLTNGGLKKRSYLRTYRCTFTNPDPDFKQKILAAGG
ncbi:unnamed protein product, partial [Didymodactylos carnosus]